MSRTPLLGLVCTNILAVMLATGCGHANHRPNLDLIDRHTPKYSVDCPTSTVRFRAPGFEGRVIFDKEPSVTYLPTSSNEREIQTSEGSGRPVINGTTLDRSELAFLSADYPTVVLTYVAALHSAGDEIRDCRPGGSEPEEYKSCGKTWVCAIYLLATCEGKVDERAGWYECDNPFTLEPECNFDC